jgi:hypothetical protein
MTDATRELIIRDSVVYLNEWYRFQDVVVFIKRHKLYEASFYSIGSNAIQDILLNYCDTKRSNCGEFPLYKRK